MNTRVYMEFIKQVMQPPRGDEGKGEQRLDVIQPREYFKRMRKMMDKKGNQIRLRKKLVKRVKLDDLDDTYGADDVISALVTKYQQHLKILRGDSTSLAEYAELKKLERIINALEKNVLYSEYLKEESLGVWKMLELEKLQKAVKKAREARDGDTSEEDDLVATFRNQLRGVERALVKCKAKKSCSQEQDTNVEKELGLVSTNKELEEERKLIKSRFDVAALEEVEGVDAALMDQLKIARSENPYAKSVFVETNPDTLEHEIIIET